MRMNLPILSSLLVVTPTVIISLPAIIKSRSANVILTVYGGRFIEGNVVQTLIKKVSKHRIIGIFDLCSDYFCVYSSLPTTPGVMKASPSASSFATSPAAPPAPIFSRISRCISTLFYSSIAGILAPAFAAFFNSSLSDRIVSLGLSLWAFLLFSSFLLLLHLLPPLLSGLFFSVVLTFLFCAVYTLLKVSFKGASPAASSPVKDKSFEEGTCHLI